MCHRYLLPKSLSVNLSLILERGSMKKSKALIMPTSTFFFCFMVVYLGEYQHFVPVGTSQLYLSREKKSAKAAIFQTR